MFSKHCGEPEDTRMNQLNKAFALPEFRNVVGKYTEKETKIFNAVSQML